MMVQNIAILFLLMTYASSAPSGCIESCTSYLKQHQTQISGDLLQTASHLGLDYSRPGTWSEHNEYNVDNGHGKVHEERGQYITGPKTVRYYKKNYSSSYSTRYPNSEIFPDFEHESNKHGVHLPTIQEVSNSQNTYNQMGNSESVGQYKYNKIQNQQHTQSSYTKSNVQNERLEDLGQYSGNSQVIQQGASNLNTQISRKPYDTNTQSGNWSSVNSYKTDGGRGRVFEEDGQYVSGAQKVRYYKRNYSSSYSSSDGIPIPEVTKIGIQDIQQEMEKLHKEIGKGFNQMSTADVMGSSNIGQTYVNTHDFSTDNIHNINSDNSRGQNSYRSSLSTAHTEEQHSSHITNDHLPYRNPYQNTYDGNSYSTHEKHEEYVKQLQPINQFINPTSGYTSVLNTGNSGYNRNKFSGSTLQQQTDNFQQAEMLDTEQSRISQTQTFLDNLRKDTQSQSSAIHSSMPGVSHYKEHWSASHTKETSIPQHSIDITHMNQQSDQYTNNQYDNRHNLYQGMQQRDNYLHQSKESGFTSGKKTLLQKLVTGADTVDCDYNSQYTHSNAQHQTKYKRSAKYDKQDEVQTHSDFNDDFTQQTREFDDLTQQTSGKPEFNQKSQLYQSWTPYTANQQSEDITQQTTEYDDLTQQTSGKLEFGQQSQQFYQSSKPHNTNQQLEEFIQKTEEHNDFIQQTSENLELEQESQQSNQSSTTHAANQLTDFNQQTDDLTQQTSRKLKFGEESQQFSQPWRLNIANQELDGLTQKTREYDSLTEQTSGKIEFGEQLQDWIPYSTNQQLDFTQQTGKFDDLTQQTGEFDDLTQQTSRDHGLEQESQQFYQPQKPHASNQELDDVTEKTREYDSLTEQTSGKLEFDQQSYQGGIPHTANQQFGLTQETGKFDDLTQQTGKFDDLTQQTSRNHELIQESQFYQPQKPHTSNQELDNLTEKIKKYDDLTQQTSGKVEFGQQSQQSYEAWDLQSTIQQLEDLIQKTKKSDNFAQQSFSQETQHSHQPWNLHNTIQQLEDLIQKTRKFDDFTQQTSRKLEFDQQSQQFYQSSKPHNTNQQLDLTQQTGEFNDFNQQTFGKLEFGQESQQSNQSWISHTANQEIEDFTQKTGELNDFTQQTSGNIELGEDSQQFHQSQKLHTVNQQLDLTQKTQTNDDLTHQTSEKVEFGQQSQQPYQAWHLQNTIQQLKDLIKKTEESDNLAQSFGQETQQSHQFWNLYNTIQQLENLIQKTRKFDDFTQQTSKNLEFGQESQHFYQSEKPYSVNQQLGSFTQKTKESDNINQQSSGKLMFDQESEQSFSTWRPSLSQQSKIFVQSEDNLPKPAEKPKPRSKYSRLGSTVNSQLPNQNQKNINLTTGNIDVYELPPEVTIEHDVDNDKNQNIRGDQGQGKDVSNNLKPQTGSSIYDNVDPVNWLHKSNDATVGLQWHYTYHPSDQRQFVQQTDQKNKESLQQQSTQAQFSNLQQNFNQETQNKYILENSQQESQNYASEQGIKSIRKPFRYIQNENKLVSDQQITENGNLQKHIETASSEFKPQPRILEVYGGGQYDPAHNEDIYSGVTVNPSATLPPESNTDPWDIREVPITTTELTLPPLPVEPLDINDTTEKPHRSSVWSRIGHKITTTFDKAKEKARSIFG